MTLKKLPALVALVAVAALNAPALASAQDQPSGPPPSGPPPQEMQGQMPSYASGEEEIHGRISQIGGKYQISVRDDRGFIDNVVLHDGTVINPRGLSLYPGQSVSILGHTDGKQFSANEIDTPYAYAGYGPGPYYYGAYYGPFYGGPYFGARFWWGGGARYYGWGGPRFYGRFYGRW